MDANNVRAQKAAAERGQIAGMFMPVRCTCGKVYDLGAVEVKGRYADCSTWNAPCCGRYADDRGETGWKQDYTVIDKTNPFPSDICGRW